MPTTTPVILGAPTAPFLENIRQTPLLAYLPPLLSFALFFTFFHSSLSSELLSSPARPAIIILSIQLTAISILSNRAFPTILCSLVCLSTAFKTLTL